MSKIYGDKVQIIPCLIGDCSHNQLYELVEEIQSKDSLLILSADLSHFTAFYRTKIDKETIKDIENLSMNKINSDKSCTNSHL